jgi:quinol monooxygenase YgiN
MIVVLTRMQYPANSEEAMRSLADGVERYSRQFDGCERFDLSFPEGSPGVLLTTEVWHDMPKLQAHVAVAHDAPELAAWHELITGMEASLYEATPIDFVTNHEGAVR